MATDGLTISQNEVNLLVAAMKNTDGTVDFQGIADEMGLPSSGAAGKRFKRFVEKIAPGEDILTGSTLGAGRQGAVPKSGRKSGADEVKIPMTPKATAGTKSTTKRKAKDEDEDEASPSTPLESANQNGTTATAKVDESPTSGKKKRKTPKKEPTTAAAKTSRAVSGKSKPNGTAKKGKSGTSDTVVIGKTATGGIDAAEASDNIAPGNGIKHENGLKLKTEDTSTTVNDFKDEDIQDTTQTNENLEIDRSTVDVQVKGDGNESANASADVDGEATKADVA